MIKVEVIKKFHYEKYEDIKDTIKRKSIDTYGELYEGDTFECSEDVADYLTGNNDKNVIVVKVIEIIPERKKSKK